MAEIGKVAIFEDDEMYRELLVHLITFCRHDVVIEGISLEQSLKAIESRVQRLGEICVDAVLLDGNLNSGQTNQDGLRIASAIREAPGGQDVFIVSIASNGKLIEGTDTPHPKLDSHGAVRLIDEFIKAKPQP